jgi:sirohydrochlorin cobaltochelatase
MPTSALLLVGHGTRSEAGTRCVERLRDLIVARLPGVLVRHCFLELRQETIERGLRDLIADGAKRIVVSPLLLFAAGHAKSDIPREMAAVGETGVEILQTAALGCHPAIVELSARRYEQAVEESGGVQDGRMCLVLVGRGSNDDQATAEMHHLAALRQARLPQVTVRVAFVAMAKPSVDQVLSEVADQSFGNVIVQPHLLFPGELLENLGQDIERRRQADGGTKWRLTQPLAADIGQAGPADELLVQAVLERAAEVAPEFASRPSLQP